MMRPTATFHPLPTRHGNHHGSVLFTVMILMVLVSLASVMMLNFSSSVIQKTEDNYGLRATYLAESGFRYAASEYLNAGQLTDKFDRLDTLDREGPVQFAGGSFEIDISSYWFMSCRPPVKLQDASGSLVYAKMAGHLPEGFALPATGKIRIGLTTYPYANPTQPGTYHPSQKKSYDVSFEVSGNVPPQLPDGNIFMVFTPPFNQTIKAGGDLTISATDEGMGLFPARNGQIEIGGEYYIYRAKRKGSIILTGLSHSDNLFPLKIKTDTEIILHRQILLQATGKAGDGALTARKVITYNVPISEAINIPASTATILDLSNGADPVNSQDTFQEFNHWDPGDEGLAPETDRKVTVHPDKTLTTEHGTSNHYLIFQNFDLIAPAGNPSAHLVPAKELPENKTASFFLPFFYDYAKGASTHPFADAWKASDHFLSYSVQVKQVWGTPLDYGAAGICFRWRASPDDPTQSEGYGLSLMRYGPEGRHDFIPDTIKPAFNALLPLNDHPLIVLWQQFVDAKGELKRQWLAYKDLSGDKNAVQNNGRFRALLSLLIQVEEKKIGGVKVNDLKIFYADARNATHHPDKRFDNTNRGVYYPTFGDPQKIKGPAGKIEWPEQDLTQWSNAKDFCTILRDVSVAKNPAPPKLDPTTQKMVHYWVINPEPFVAGITLLQDGYTLRTQAFTSPDTGGFGAKEKHPEIALHAFGGIESYASQKIIGMADFALKLGMATEAVSQASGFGAIQ